MKLFILWSWFQWNPSTALKYTSFPHLLSRDVCLSRRQLHGSGVPFQLCPESKSEEQESDGNVALREWVPYPGLILWILVLFSFYVFFYLIFRRKKSRQSKAEIIEFGIKRLGYFILKDVNDLISIRTNDWKQADMWHREENLANVQLTVICSISLWQRTTS